jgi:hypothetical protein
MKLHPLELFLVAVALSMSSTQSLQAAEVTVERSDRGAVVKIDGELFAEYLTRSGHQPAVWPVIGPTGQPMTRSWPCGPQVPGEMDDHPHHHSLWFTHGDVNGFDFWTGRGLREGDGIIHREFVTLESLGSTAKIVTRNDWIANGKKVCEDQRTLVFGTSEPDDSSEPGRPRTRSARWTDFTVTLKATDGDLTFGETKEGSWGVRTSGPLTVDSRQGAHIVNNRSQQDGQAWGMFAEWIDDYGPVDGQVVGIAMFSHPDNFRHPTRWHARTYGLLAANPFGEGEFPRDASAPKQGPVTVARGDELTLRYRLLLHAGDPEEANVAAAYREFAAD